MCGLMHMGLCVCDRLMGEYPKYSGIFSGKKALCCWNSILEKMHCPTGKVCKPQALHGARVEVEHTRATPVAVDTQLARHAARAVRFPVALVDGERHRVRRASVARAASLLERGRAHASSPPRSAEPSRRRASLSLERVLESAF